MRTITWTSVAAPEQAFHLAANGPRDWRGVDAHDHDFAELFWVTHGRGRHEVNGQFDALMPNRLVFLRPTDGHAVHCAPQGGLGLVNLAFPTHNLIFLRERYGVELPELWPAAAALPVTVTLSAAQARWLRSAFDLLGTAPRSQLALDRFLLNLLNELGGHGRLAAWHGAPDWLRQAGVAVHAPEHFRRGPRGLAALAGRSLEHVSRVLKRHTGKTPCEVVNTARLDYAARQLSADDAKILDVVQECGFRSVSHFYAQFRRQFGVSPRRYRLRSKGVF
jgi:AraC family cel operon transcriptional repressor